MLKTNNKELTDVKFAYNNQHIQVYLMQNISLTPQMGLKPAPGTLLDAIYRRRTSRLFIPKPLSPRHLSQLMWAAYGINRPDGHRTVPAAMGLYPLRIYAFMPGGVYLYNPEYSILEAIVEGDHRKIAGMQDFVPEAPISIIIFSDFDTFRTGKPEVDKAMEGNEAWASALDAGAVAENIYLYCSSEDINVVERMMVDVPAVKKLLSLPESCHFQVAMTVGYGA